MRRAAAGDRGAFEEVVRRLAPAVLRLTTAVLGGAAVAQDAAQEALLLAFRRASTYRPELGPVRPWLLGIARREALRLVARPSEQPLDAPLGELGLAAGWAADDPERLLADAEQRERLAWAVASLGPHDREVLVLRDVEGVSGEQAAAVLGVDLATMKSRLHRARLRLMAALRERNTVMAEHERSEGGLRCGQVLELLSDYVDAHLSPELRASVEQHFRGCTVCERFGGRFSRTVSAVRSRLAQPSAVDAATYQAVLGRLRQPS